MNPIEKWRIFFFFYIYFNFNRQLKKERIAQSKIIIHLNGIMRVNEMAIVLGK